MPARGKHGKPTSAFPPFPPSLNIRKTGGMFTFPPLLRFFLYKGQAQNPCPEHLKLGVGKIKLPKWAKFSCQKQPVLHVPTYVEILLIQVYY